jgi:hypothetical protein
MCIFDGHFVHSFHSEILMMKENNEEGGRMKGRHWLGNGLQHSIQSFGEMGEEEFQKRKPLNIIGKLGGSRRQIPNVQKWMSSSPSSPFASPQSSAEEICLFQQFHF